MSGQRVMGINPKLKTNNHIIRRRNKKLKRKAVLKMLAVMEASQKAGPSHSDESSPPSRENSNSNSKDFLASGRTGRRNALPDILAENANVSSSDLPSKLEALTTTDTTTESQNNQPKDNQPSTSKS